MSDQHAVIRPTSEAIEAAALRAAQVATATRDFAETLGSTGLWNHDNQLYWAMLAAARCLEAIVVELHRSTGSGWPGEVEWRHVVQMRMACVRLERNLAAHGKALGR